MKIVKLVHCHERYFVIFDYIPNITYEECGGNFIGSALDEHGNIIFSCYLKGEYGSYNHAFGGAELTLEMKDGSSKTIKNNWYDAGYYSSHGEFIPIGGGTLEKLQKCFVFCSYNINFSIFKMMIAEYLRFDRTYEYHELEKWVEGQYEWFPIIFHGNKIPFMMNKYGEVAQEETKEREYCLFTKYNNKTKKEYKYFKLEYENNNRLIKLEDSYKNVCMATLPFSKKEIINNCKL